MTQKMLYAAPILNVPRSIREDESDDHNDTKQGHQEEEEEEEEEENEDEDDDDDLIFGALDDEDSSKDKLDGTSLSTDEKLHLQSDTKRTKKRERTYSSMSAVDDEWDNMLSITDGEGPSMSHNHYLSMNEKNSFEQVIGMSNFRAKHRLRRRSKTNALIRWKYAVKKVVQLKDPW
jgi:hypothetical protein